MHVKSKEIVVATYTIFRTKLIPEESIVEYLTYQTDTGTFNSCCLYGLGVAINVSLVIQYSLDNRQLYMHAN